MRERGITASKLRSLINQVIRVPASHHLLKPPVEDNRERLNSDTRAVGHAGTWRILYFVI